MCKKTRTTICEIVSHRLLSAFRKWVNGVLTPWEDSSLMFSCLPLVQRIWMERPGTAGSDSDAPTPVSFGPV